MSSSSCLGTTEPLGCDSPPFSRQSLASRSTDDVASLNQSSDQRKKPCHQSLSDVRELLHHFAVADISASPHLSSDENEVEGPSSSPEKTAIGPSASTPPMWLLLSPSYYRFHQSFLRSYQTYNNHRLLSPMGHKPPQVSCTFPSTEAEDDGVDLQEQLILQLLALSPSSRALPGRPEKKCNRPAWPMLPLILRALQHYGILQTVTAASEPLPISTTQVATTSPDGLLGTEIVSGAALATCLAFSGYYRCSRAPPGSSTPILGCLFGPWLYDCLVISSNRLQSLVAMVAQKPLPFVLPVIAASAVVPASVVVLCLISRLLRYQLAKGRFRALQHRPFDVDHFLTLVYEQRVERPQGLIVVGPYNHGTMDTRKAGVCERAKLWAFSCVPTALLFSDLGSEGGTSLFYSTLALYTASHRVGAHIPSPSNYYYFFLPYCCLSFSHASIILRSSAMPPRPSAPHPGVIWLGCGIDGAPTVAIRQVEVVQQILSRPTLFPKTPEILTQMRQTLGDGLAFSEGPKWQRARRSLTGSFHFGSVREYSSLVVANVCELVDSWDRLLADEDALQKEDERKDGKRDGWRPEEGDSEDVTKMLLVDKSVSVLSDLSSCIIIDCLFGGELNKQWVCCQWRKILQSATTYFAGTLLFGGWWGYVPLSSNRLFLSALKDMRVVLALYVRAKITRYNSLPDKTRWSINAESSVSTCPSMSFRGSVAAPSGLPADICKNVRTEVGAAERPMTPPTVCTPVSSAASPDNCRATPVNSLDCPSYVATTPCSSPASGSWGLSRSRCSTSLVDHLIESGETDVHRIVDEALMFLLAARDTTSAVVSWVLFVLHHHPLERHTLVSQIDQHITEQIARRRLASGRSCEPSKEGEIGAATGLGCVSLDEVELAVDELAKGSLMFSTSTSYCMCVLKETLRMFPPAPLLDRVTTVPLTVQGVQLPAGTNMWLDLLHLHFDPSLWSSSFPLDSFHPLRWGNPLGNSIRRISAEHASPAEAHAAPFSADVAPNIGAHSLMEDHHHRHRHHHHSRQGFPPGYVEDASRGISHHVKEYAGGGTPSPFAPPFSLSLDDPQWGEVVRPAAESACLLGRNGRVGANRFHKRLAREVMEPRCMSKYGELPSVVRRKRRRGDSSDLGFDRNGGQTDGLAAVGSPTMSSVAAAPEAGNEPPFLHPFAYLPFSAGPRNCLGQKLALNECVLMLYVLLFWYNVDVDNASDCKPIVLSTYLPGSNVRLAVSKRLGRSCRHVAMP
eukprot:GHVS01099309.1.p1 GENE.GHVS01099309.1~~GHVS01099309.1.p1  ORF type:complete len:1247 (+),score=181.73 GHVS01099309.1:504-4244(+)